ncbi:Ig-like domain-containing protein [Psychromonas hadalis]|uniref:Ig-like domain-containing protein n=1 Tax=Psychromonas hadalis TaxID=211669 RepID=UPI0003B36AE7|nr:cadherin-like domain-containing protein [Psychromonas hadalis]
MSSHDLENKNDLGLEEVDPADAKQIVNSINQTLENDLGELNAVDQESLAEIAAIQAAIEEGDIEAVEDIETAAGDAGSDGGFDAVTLSRNGSESTASSEFSTDEFSLSPINNEIIDTNLSEVNIAPTLVVDGGSIDEDAGSITVPYSAQDTDGVIVSTTASVPAEQGTVSVNQIDGTITFTPAPNFNGDAVITVVTTDDGGATATEDTTIVVNPVIDPVYAQISVDQSSVSEGGILTYTVSLVDADNNPVVVPAGDSVNVQLDWTGLAAGGADTSALPASVNVTGDSQVTFQIDAVDDFLAEGSEPLIVTISGVTDTDSNYEAVAADEDNKVANSAITDEEVFGPEDTITQKIPSLYKSLR